MYPSGHVQTGSCLTTLQFALGAQGLSSAHGLIHAEFRHAVKSGQSSFVWHPISIGSTSFGGTNKIHFYNNWQLIVKIKDLTQVASIASISSVTSKACASNVMHSSCTGSIRGTLEN